MKRIKLLILLLAIVASTASAWAQETSGTCGDNLTWKYNAGTLTLSGTGAMYDYGSYSSYFNEFSGAAPWMEHYWDKILIVIINEGVTQIGNYAFYHCERLASVSLPSSLTSIGGSAFSACRNLPTINFPEGLTSIGKSAFSICLNLPTINLPEGLKSIGEGAFAECRALTSLVLPASLESLGNFAFQMCDSLTSVELPASLKNIGNYVFQNSKKISDITVHWTSLEGVSVGNNIFNSHPNPGSITLHIPAGTKSIYENADPWKDLKIVEEEQGIEEIRTNPAVNGRKVIYNGQVYILQEGKSYTLTGTEVR